MDYYMRLYAPDLKKNGLKDKFSEMGKRNYHHNNISSLKQHGLNVINSVKHNKNYNIDQIFNNHFPKHYSPTRSNKNRGSAAYMSDYLNDYLPNILSQSLERNRMNNFSVSDNRYNDTITENFLDIEEAYLYNYFVYVSTWIDLDLIGNKNSLSNTASKFLKEFENYFIINCGRTSIFNNDEVNSVFKKTFKFALIIISFVKICASEFIYFDNVVKIHLKKNISSLCEIICVVYEIFIISNRRESFYYRKDLVDKIGKISKLFISSSQQKNYGKLNIDSIISNLNTKFNNLLLNLRSFSNSFFNTTTFQLFHKVFIGLIDEIDDIKLDEFGDLVINHILFNYLNTEYEGNDISEISNNVSNSSPYLPVNSNKDCQYTLILDLDETLIHYFLTPSGGRFFVRPGAHNFLKDLSKFYEIVIFTAGTKEYADKILNLFDKNKVISYRLYRNHTTFLNDSSLKDLNLIGRKINKTIFIDNIPENFRNFPNNGFGCKSWTDEISDKQLNDLKQILLFIAESKSEDVREIIKKINDLAATTYKEYVNPFSHIDLKNLQ